MKCQSCGSENPEEKKFCSKCGAPLMAFQPKQFCPNCGKEITPGKKFCGGCGAKVSDGSAGQGTSKAQETSGETEVLTALETPKEQKAPEKPEKSEKVQQEPREIHHEEKKKHTGLLILLAVIAIVFAAVGGFCIYRLIIAPPGEIPIYSHIADTVDEKEDDEKEDDEKETESDLTEGAAKEADSNWGGLLQGHTSEQDTETYLSAETQPVYETQPESQGALYGEAQGQTMYADYILPGSDSRYLTAADLVSLTKEQMRIARNEVYARHGRIFKTDDLNAYFLSKPWYTATVDPENFTDDLLNVYEKYNVKFIQEQENNMN